MFGESVSMKTNPPRPFFVLHAHSESVQFLMLKECSSDDIESKTAPPSTESGLVHCVRVVLESEKEVRRKCGVLTSEGVGAESEVAIDAN